MVVVGNESAAVSGALTLLFYTSEVHLISQALEEAESLAYQVEESDVHLHIGRKVKKIIGDEKLEGIIMDNIERLDVGGLFSKKEPRAPSSWPLSLGSR